MLNSLRPCITSRTASLSRSGPMRESAISEPHKPKFNRTLLLGLILAGATLAQACAAEAPQQCKRGERLLQPSGLCGSPSVAGCFDAQMPGATRKASSATAEARTVRIRIENKGSAPLYFKAAPGARTVEFELRSAQGPLASPETLFCPTLCPKEGAVKDVDCGRAAPALIEVRPGASTFVDWSGRLAVETARACGDGAERRCRSIRPARPGRYVIRLCAYPGIENPNAQRTETGSYLARMRPSGSPRCLSTAFDYLAKGVVAAVFR